MFISQLIKFHLIEKTILWHCYVYFEQALGFSHSTLSPNLLFFFFFYLFIWSSLQIVAKPFPIYVYINQPLVYLLTFFFFLLPHKILGKDNKATNSSWSDFCYFPSKAYDWPSVSSSLIFFFLIFSSLLFASSPPHEWRCF